MSATPAVAERRTPLSAKVVTEQPQSAYCPPGTTTDVARKHVLVTGAAGLVGASVIQSLLAEFPDVAVRGVIHHTSPIWCDSRVEYVTADLTDRSACRRAVRGCEWVVAAAGCSAGSGGSPATKLADMTTNLQIDAATLAACGLEGVSRVLYLSSATVYAEGPGLRSEDQLDLNQLPPATTAAAAAGKRAAELLCRAWAGRDGLSVTVVRCANVYGPGARFAPDRSSFIAALVRKAVDHLDPFPVWGDETTSRDVIYSADSAVAITALLCREGAGAFDVYNLGSGEPVTVGEVVRCVLRCAGHTPSQVVFSGPVPGVQRTRSLDCSKLRGIFNWRPRYRLCDGIAATVRWWQENRDTWTR